MRIVVVSDTHAKHGELGSLEGDVLVHCGDFCNAFEEDPRELESLDAWFAEQSFELVLCVGGNHDFAAEERAGNGRPIFRHAVWLQDAAHTHRGVTFYGAPWLPHLEGWAFYQAMESRRKRWAMIPDDTQVLITHTPPLGILDVPSSGKQHCGCPHLLDRVKEVRPAFHLFGHIHASAGVEEQEFTTFVNASVVGRGYKVVRPAVSLDLPA